MTGSYSQRLALQYDTLKHKIGSPTSKRITMIYKQVILLCLLGHGGNSDMVRANRRAYVVMNTQAFPKISFVRSVLKASVAVVFSLPRNFVQCLDEGKYFSLGKTLFSNFEYTQQAISVNNVFLHF